ncbi:MAG: ABC transporter permease [Clostridia bacterium]|nr:ABC transporter permease [Clostridia bacterium]MCR5694796.1 ABC transporter permease [Clostridia bacterium]
MDAVFKRELQSYFKSPVAYCIIAFFGVLTGLYFWNVNLYNGSIEFTMTLGSLTTFLIFFIPVITMKLFSEDRKNGTEVLLMTSPVPTWQIVVGKYLASVVVFSCMVAETIICPLIMMFHVNSEGVFPLAMTVGGYIAFFLLGLAYLSVGAFASSVTDSQPIAAVLGVILLIGITFIETIGETVKGVLGTILVWLSLSSRYTDFSSGLFNFSSLIFYLTFTVMMLFITITNIERKRWN